SDPGRRAAMSQVDALSSIASSARPHSIWNLVTPVLGRSGRSPYAQRARAPVSVFGEFSAIAYGLRTRPSCLTNPGPGATSNKLSVCYIAITITGWPCYRNFGTFVLRPPEGQYAFPPSMRHEEIANLKMPDVAVAAPSVLGRAEFSLRAVQHGGG